MTRKERNQMELMSASDTYKILRKRLKDEGYDISINEIKCVINLYVDLIYSCMLAGIRVMIPNLGEFYRDIRKGRKAGYYNVPNSRDEHTKFDKNMVWKKEYKEKASDWGRIAFAVQPKIKKQFREETEGKV